MIIENPNNALVLLEKLKHYKREHFFAVLLRKDKSVIKVLDMTSKSCKHSAEINRRNFWSEVLLNRAVGIIIAHNHPCGTLEASEEDIHLTKELLKGAEILGIQILDHLIVTRDGYFSFLEHDIFN